VVVSTFLPVHDDTSEVSNFRARSEQQLIEAAKTGCHTGPLSDGSSIGS
jgi:hypothetical protein